MTVRELIELLQACDPDAVVCVTDDDMDVPLNNDASAAPCLVVMVDGKPCECAGDNPAHAEEYRRAIENVSAVPRVVTLAKGVVIR